MTAPTVLGIQERTVRVALEDRHLVRGLSDLRWRLPRLLAGGTDTLVIDLSGPGRPR